MNTLLKLLLLAFLCSTFLLYCSAGNAQNNKPMDDMQLAALKAQLGITEVENAWALSGEEANDPSTGCLYSRLLYTYSQPALVHGEILVSNRAELLYKASKQSSKVCADLRLVKEVQLKVGRYFSGNDGEKILGNRDVRGFFTIRGQVSPEQLVTLKQLIDAVPGCISNQSSCSTAKLDIALPADAMNRVEKIRSVNVSSVEGQASPDGGGPFIILFKPYSANQLVVFISDLTKSRPSIRVTYLMQ